MSQAGESTTTIVGMFKDVTQKQFAVDAGENGEPIVATPKEGHEADCEVNDVNMAESEKENENSTPEKMPEDGLNERGGIVIEEFVAGTASGEEESTVRLSKMAPQDTLTSSEEGIPREVAVTSTASKHEEASEDGIGCVQNAPRKLVSPGPAQTEEKSDKMKFEKAAEIDTFGSEKFTKDLAVQSMNLKERSDSSDLIAANLQEPITSASYEVLMDQWLPAISHRDITEVQQLGEDGVLNKVLVARRFKFKRGFTEVIVAKDLKARSRLLKGTEYAYPEIVCPPNSMVGRIEREKEIELGTAREHFVGKETTEGISLQKDEFKLEGYAKKKNRYGFWQNRHFVMKGQDLSYYAASSNIADAREPKIVMNVYRECNLAIQKANVLHLYLDADRIYRLRFSTISEAKQWRQYVYCAMIGKSVIYENPVQSSPSNEGTKNQTHKEADEDELCEAAQEKEKQDDGTETAKDEDVERWKTFEKELKEELEDIKIRLEEQHRKVSEAEEEFKHRKEAWDAAREARRQLEEGCQSRIKAPNTQSFWWSLLGLEGDGGEAEKEDRSEEEEEDKEKEEKEEKVTTDECATEMSISTLGRHASKRWQGDGSVIHHERGIGAETGSGNGKRPAKAKEAERRSTSRSMTFI